jgi:SAM-dependent methyltransferase
MGNYNFEPLPYKHYKELSELELTYWWHCSRYFWIERILKNINCKYNQLNVLDYGCGTGGFLYKLQSYFNFSNHIGVDASEIAIGMARQYGEHYSVSQTINENNYLEIDIIFLMDVLEHIEFDEIFLDELFAKIPSGARIVLSVPSLSLLMSSWDKTLGHFRRHDKKTIKLLFSKFDCEIEYITYGFSYLVIPTYIKRIIMSSSNSTNCEFPRVNSFTNSLLILLNKIEIMLHNYIPIPFGTSLFCVIKKH